MKQDSPVFLKDVRTYVPNRKLNEYSNFQMIRVVYSKYSGTSLSFIINLCKMPRILELIFTKWFLWQVNSTQSYLPVRRWPELIAKMWHGSFPKVNCKKIMDARFNSRYKRYKHEYLDKVQSWATIWRRWWKWQTFRSTRS